MKRIALITSQSLYVARRDQFGKVEILGRVTDEGVTTQYTPGPVVSDGGTVSIGHVFRWKPQNGGGFAPGEVTAMPVLAIIDLPYRTEPEQVQPDTIPMTPSDEGYVNIAKTFLSSVMTDVKVRRRNDVAAQLGQVLTIVGYLAQHGRPDLAKSVIDYAESL